MWHSARMRVLLASIAPGTATAQAFASMTDDERAVRKLAREYETGWNKHDMKLLGHMRTDDVDFVVVTGEHERVREASIARLAELHRTQFRDSTWTNEHVTVQFLRPDVALVHIERAIQRDRDPDDTPRSPRRGIFTWVVVKQGEEWKLRAAHNTNKR
jgi:uncharacterized protein (TIGR02246 family)